MCNCMLMTQLNKDFALQYRELWANIAPAPTDGPGVEANGLESRAQPSATCCTSSTVKEADPGETKTTVKVIDLGTSSREREKSD